MLNYELNKNDFVLVMDYQYRTYQWSRTIPVTEALRSSIPKQPCNVGFRLNIDSQLMK